MQQRHLALRDAMIRNFDWRDVGLVKALSEQGLCLDSETALIHGAHPLQSALLDFLMPGMGTPTLIARSKEAAEPAAFGQLHHPFGAKEAHILFIAPQLLVMHRPEDAPTAPAHWLEVVEHLAQRAGARGAQNLLAEVDEASCEFDALRTAGFAIYARQSVWKLTAASAPRETVSGVPLRPGNAADAIGVATLYSNIVPRLVQQVEHPPRHIERGYVLEQHGELIAFIDVRRGPLGVWVKPYLHPEAYDVSDAVLQACLGQLAHRNDKPIYVCVPRYEDWLQEVATRAGFEALGSQAVMVKRLTVRVTEPLFNPLPVVEAHPTPVVRAHIQTDDPDALIGSALAHWSDYAKANHGRPARSDERDPSTHRRRSQRRQPHGRTAGSHPRFGPRAHRALH
jgi:hypothetical protein